MFNQFKTPAPSNAFNGSTSSHERFDFTLILSLFIEGCAPLKSVKPFEELVEKQFSCRKRGQLLKSHTTSGVRNPIEVNKN
jgi:hypothetical protein